MHTTDNVADRQTHSDRGIGPVLGQHCGQHCGGIDQYNIIQWNSIHNTILSSCWLKAHCFNIQWYSVISVEGMFVCVFVVVCLGLCLCLFLFYVYVCFYVLFLSLCLGLLFNGHWFHGCFFVFVFVCLCVYTDTDFKTVTAAHAWCLCIRNLKFNVFVFIFVIDFAWPQALDFTTVETIAWVCAMSF